MLAFLKRLLRRLWPFGPASPAQPPARRRTSGLGVEWLDDRAPP